MPYCSLTSNWREIPSKRRATVPTDFTVGCQKKKRKQKTDTTMKKLSIPTREGMVDDHFGHCAYYTVVTLGDHDEVIATERLDSPEGCGCKSNIASVMQEMGITLMLAGNMGMGAYNKLTAHGIAVVRGCHGKVDDVLRAYLKGELTDSLESCDYHDCSHHADKPVFTIPKVS